jgi:hypothetical protein
MHACFQAGKVSFRNQLRRPRGAECRPAPLPRGLSRNAGDQLDQLRLPAAAFVLQTLDQITDASITDGAVNFFLMIRESATTMPRTARS